MEVVIIGVTKERTITMIRERKSSFSAGDIELLNQGLKEEGINCRVIQLITEDDVELKFLRID